MNIIRNIWVHPLKSIIGCQGRIPPFSWRMVLTLTRHCVRKALPASSCSRIPPFSWRRILKLTRRWEITGPACLFLFARTFYCYSSKWVAKDGLTVKRSQALPASSCSQGHFTAAALSASQYFDLVYFSGRSIHQHIRVSFIYCLVLVLWGSGRLRDHSKSGVG